MDKIEEVAKLLAKFSDPAPIFDLEKYWRQLPVVLKDIHRAHAKEIVAVLEDAP